MQLGPIARLRGAFIARPVTVRLFRRGQRQLHSQTFAKAVPLRGVCSSPFACVWHLHGPLLQGLHMNGARRTLEVYNFLREKPAGVLDICFVWVGSGTMGASPGDKQALRLDFRERERQLAGARSVLGAGEGTWDERSDVQSDTAGSRRDTLPSRTPLQGQ